jgi:hypothetical protein
MMGERPSHDGMYERAADLLEAELADEILALDPKEGACFGFNPVAASVWRRLERPASFDDLMRALLEEYDVSDEQCTRELEELIKVMIGHGLVRRSPLS